MDIISVFEHFKILVGFSDQEDASPYLPLCAVSLASVTAKLNSAVDISECHMLVAAAAASDAYYNYVLANASREGDSSFTAGDIRVNENISSTIESAKALRDNRFSAISHLFADRDFDFKAVEGI